MNDQLVRKIGILSLIGEISKSENRREKTRERERVAMC
jgi:hypothetical protein